MVEVDFKQSPYYFSKPFIDILIHFLWFQDVVSSLNILNLHLHYELMFLYVP